MESMTMTKQYTVRWSHKPLPPAPSAVAPVRRRRRLRERSPGQLPPDALLESPQLATAAGGALLSAQQEVTLSPASQGGHVRSHRPQPHGAERGGEVSVEPRPVVAADGGPDVRRRRRWPPVACDRRRAGVTVHGYPVGLCRDGGGRWCLRGGLGFGRFLLELLQLANHLG